MFTKWFYWNVNLMYEEDDCVLWNDTTLSFFDYYYKKAEDARIGNPVWEDMYVVEGKLLVVFKEVMSALYSNKVKDDDIRRDMANRMEAVFNFDKLED